MWSTCRRQPGRSQALVPGLTAFRDRHRISDLVVVADVGMLSPASLLALEEAGFTFADHFRRHGNAFGDGHTTETIRAMATGTVADERRVAYEYKFTRSQHDNRVIDKVIERAKAVAVGNRPIEEGPVRQDHRRRQWRGLCPGGPGTLPGPG